MNYEDYVRLVNEMVLATQLNRLIITILIVVVACCVIAVIIAIFIACKAKSKVDSKTVVVSENMVVKDQRDNAKYGVLMEKLSTEHNTNERKKIQAQMDQIKMKNSAEYAMATRLIKAEQRIAELEKLVKSLKEK